MDSNNKAIIKQTKLTGFRFNKMYSTATAPSWSPGAAAWLICPVPRAASIMKLSPMQRHALTASNTHCLSAGINTTTHAVGHWIHGVTHTDFNI